MVITHGNGPQVGFILLRSELAKEVLHEVPLDTCGADTQGALDAIREGMQHAGTFSSWFAGYGAAQGAVKPNATGKPPGGKAYRV